MIRFHTGVRAVGACTLAVLTSACAAGTGEHAEADDAVPHVTGGADDIERGKYLVTLGGCNDCHTDGYLMTEGQVPESQWLLGSPMGWRGPWGTSYAKNLRHSVANMTEDQWVEILRGSGLPPMPWMNVNQFAESDTRAIYRYISQMGDPGEPMPLPVPPDEEPTTPYLNLTPVIPGG